MSPEQAAGRAIDARSDIFSFGVLLYELLAGRPPFDGCKLFGSAACDLPPGAGAAGEDIPPALRKVVEKALEKDPADRYQSMRELVVDLRRLARRQPDESMSPAATASQQGSGAATWKWRAGWLAILPVALVAASQVGFCTRG